MNDWIPGKEKNTNAWLYISTYAQIIQRMGQAGFEQQKCEAHEMIQGGKLNLFLLISLVRSKWTFYLIA